MHPHRLSWWELWEHARTAGPPRKPTPSAHHHPQAQTKGSLGCWLRRTNPSHAHSQTGTGSILTRWAPPPSTCKPRIARIPTVQQHPENSTDTHSSGQLMGVRCLHDHRPSLLNNQIPPRVVNGSLNPRTNSSPRRRSQLRSNLSTRYRTWGHGGVEARSSSSNAAPREEHEPPRSEASRLRTS